MGYSYTGSNYAFLYEDEIMANLEKVVPAKFDAVETAILVLSLETYANVLVRMINSEKNEQIRTLRRADLEKVNAIRLRFIAVE